MFYLHNLKLKIKSVNNSCLGQFPAKSKREGNTFHHTVAVFHERKNGKITQAYV